MAAGAEDNIWLKTGDGTGISGTPGRKVPGSLGSTGLDVGKPKVPDVPEIGGRGTEKKDNIIGLKIDELKVRDNKFLDANGNIDWETWAK